jgi:hypothetical protein
MMAGCAAETGSRGGDVIGLVLAETSVVYTDSGRADAFWLVTTTIIAAGLIAWALGFGNDEPRE